MVAKKPVKTEEKVKKPVVAKSVKAKIEGIAVFSVGKTGNKSEKSLNKEVFGQKPNAVLLAQTVRVLLANKRKAHAKTKRRGEVNRSTAKVYKQKGTGNARHGSRSAPIYVGGGIAHGPRGIENYHRTVPQKMRQKALISALSARATEGKLFVFDVENNAKTKVLATSLKKNEIGEGATFVYNKESFVKVVRNIEGLRSVRAQNLTALDVLAGKALILTEEAVEILEKRLIKQ